MAEMRQTFQAFGSAVARNRSPARGPKRPRRIGGPHATALESAVLELQRDAGNGAVAVALQRLGSVPDQQEKAATEQSHRTLRRGDSGADVKTLQIKLDRMSFRDSKDKLDGKFGPKTFADVVQFQETHGFSGDGIVGPLTWNALDTYTPQDVHEADELVADEVFAQGKAAQKAGEFELAIAMFTTVLGLPATSSKETRIGSLINRGMDQQRLGRFRAAVVDFEAALASAHTGTERRAFILSMLQRARRNLPIDAVLEEAVDGVGDGGGITTRPDLAPGSSGPDVELLQNKLFSLQLETTAEGPTDTGVLDRGTLGRLTVFKSEVGLEPSPVVDGDTWHALDSYSPQDKSPAERRAFSALRTAGIAQMRSDLAGGLHALDAAESLAWTPELLARLRVCQGRSHQARSEFGAAVRLYREALELPRLPRAGFDPPERAQILKAVLESRRGQPARTLSP